MPPFNFGKSETLRNQLNTDCYFSTTNFITLHEGIVSLIKAYYDNLQKQYIENNMDVQGFPKFSKRKVIVSNSKTLSFTTMPTWLYDKKGKKDEARDKNFITINDLLGNNAN